MKKLMSRHKLTVITYSLLVVLGSSSVNAYNYTDSKPTDESTIVTPKDSGLWDRVTTYFATLVSDQSSKSDQSLVSVSANFDCAPPPSALKQVRATKSGNWDNPATWGGVLPADGDMVVIPKGTTVTITKRESARIQFIEVNGTLTMDPQSNTRLMVETLKVESSGSLLIGSIGAPVASSALAEIVFLDNGPIANPTLSNRGLIVEGTCKIYGQRKIPFVNAGDARAGATAIRVGQKLRRSWRAGDQIVIPGTTYNPGKLTLNLAGNERKENQKPSREQIAQAFTDEKVTIRSIRGNVIRFTPALRFNHVRPKASLPFHVANVSRNVVFRSESDVSSRRGHTMFMRGSDVYIQGAAFFKLGRTDKRIPLDDFEVATKRTSGAGRGQARRKSNPASIKNNRGRYAVHFHRNGVNENDINTALATVTHCVVEDTPGWGFVNHSSHVDFRNNVAYNFTGAGFVTEIGDELGTFDGNMAIQGHGNGELRERRLGFKMNSRLPVINDFGFGGDGFWFQGPAVRATNNVAASCNGSGMIWFATGGVQDALIDNSWTHGIFVGMRESIARKVYPGFGSSIRPRQIVEGYQNASERVYLLADFPVLECTNNTFYSSHIGFNLRFVNTVAHAFFRQGPYNKHFRSNNVKRTQQSIRNQVLWNNFIAINASYTQSTKFDNIEIYNAQRRFYGTDTNWEDFAIQGEHASGLQFSNLDLEGYGHGAIFQRSNSKFINADLIKNTANNAVRLHLNNRSCDLLKVNSAQWRNNSTMRVNFSTDSKQEKVAIRYKATDALHWIYRSFETKNGSIDLNGLDNNKTYQYQLLRGCGNGVSPKWSDTRTIGANKNPDIDSTLSSVKIYPNPVATTLYVNMENMESDVQRISIYNLLGQQVKRTISQEQLNQSAIDVSNFEEGLYLVEVVFEDGIKIAKKITIKR